MNNKIVLLGIAVLAVGVIALPETVAMFAEQHTWYPINQNNPSDSGVPCIKCHIDVQQQIDSPANGAHKNLKCETCHVVSQLAKGATLGGTGTIHAAASPLCMDCHDGSAEPGAELDPHMFPGSTNNCQNCHYDINNLLKTNMNATSIYQGKDEVHKNFAQGANYSTLLKGSNEACIACHTHVSVDIVWTKPTNLTFTASHGVNGWEVGNFNKTGAKIINTTGN